MSDSSRKSMLPCCGTFADTGEHTKGCRTPVFEKLAADRAKRRQVAFGSDKESRSVVDERNAAKPDTGSSEDRQHENPCHEPTQLCGHPVSAVVSSDEGTAYCATCAQEPTCGIAGCVGKHYPQDHNAIFDTSTDDQSRSLFHSLQDAIRERDALRAELERVRGERNTIHDWYVDAKTENVRLRALIRKDTNDE